MLMRGGTLRDDWLDWKTTPLGQSLPLSGLFPRKNFRKVLVIGRRTLRRMKPVIRRPPQLGVLVAVVVLVVTTVPAGQGLSRPELRDSPELPSDPVRCCREAESVLGAGPHSEAPLK